ncbi:hypothetical protein [Solirubrum puertoriconensis]|uniref:Uncharacterized protein n=1 Tax=Solirubrum puertoriconensis TaxID=1751427 RepID=A0A9X0HL13_SOLP1|nr:hypothetical protein [Solirubrum puertoriconensis]KUG07918.1 hypothetical protein ASU33_06830 [Solirubrum puertoriconensis]
MSTYLSTAELKARVHLGKEVEQWLSYEQEAEYSFIRWLSIGKDRSQFTITYFESLDEGDQDFHDVHEFSVLDPEDAPYGVTHEFYSVEDALSFAAEAYGASADKFVAGGMIYTEYAKHLLQPRS